VHLTFTVVIEGESDEALDERTRALCSIFHNDLECEVIVEDDIGLGQFPAVGASGYASLPTQ